MKRAASGRHQSEASHAATLTIDLDALVANWRDLGARAAPASCAAVVKADAYGCGIGPVTRALSRAGCETFFVAHLAEGEEVRGEALGAAIYVLNGLPAGLADGFARSNLRPVLGSPEEVAEWDGFCRASGWLGGAALHVDTGMNRLGLDAEEAAALVEQGPGAAKISLLMSHLACAEDAAHPLNARQIARFRLMRDLFPGVPGSLANSSGIFLGADAAHDLVRPGIALYGGNPTPAHLNPMRPVVTLEAPVLRVRDIEAGDVVGYGATWTAQQPARIAIVSMGYADGFPRSAGASDLQAGADVIIAGRRCPLAGRVSMDLLAVDVSSLADHLPRRGDPVGFLTAEIGVDELASHAGTIGYEVLTRLGRRYRRVYSGG